MCFQCTWAFLILLLRSQERHPNVGVKCPVSCVGCPVPVSEKIDIFAYSVFHVCLRLMRRHQNSRPEAFFCRGLTIVNQQCLVNDLTFQDSGVTKESWKKSRLLY